MRATTPIFSLHILTSSYEGIPAKVLLIPIKYMYYGKGTGSLLPVFTVKSTGIYHSIVETMRLNNCVLALFDRHIILRCSGKLCNFIYTLKSSSLY